MLLGVVIDGIPTLFKDVPTHVLPPEVCKSLTRDDRGGLHVSDLQYCSFNTVRQKMFDYYYPVRQAWNLVRGNAWDRFFADNAVDGGIYGQSFERTINGEILIGTPDIIFPKLHQIYDVKSPAWMPKPDADLKRYYTWQLNAYRWLVSELWTIDRLYLYQCGSSGYLMQEHPVHDLQGVDTEIKCRLDRYLEIKHGPLAGSTCSDPKCFGCTSKTPEEATYWVEK